MSHTRHREIIDLACDGFESSWRDSDRQSILDVLESCPETVREDLFIQLCLLEMELTVRDGDFFALSDYKERFPDKTESLERAFHEFSHWLNDTDAIDEKLKSRVRQSDRETQSHALATRNGSQMPPAKPSQTASRTPGYSSRSIPKQIGRYQIQHEIGRGGMGTVLVALDTVLDRQVALKIPEFNAHQEDEAIERFYREARAMATVRHPNLCPIHDVGKHQGRPFLTMAYIDGHTLADEINGPMETRKAISLVRKIALAIQAAHTAGVLHRDLKPSNVMIDNAGEPFITDFGLASRDGQDSELTQSGAMIGSPAYMAPEQVKGDRSAIGPQTDIYALGIIFYELLCGRRPFLASGLAVLGEITSGKQPALPSSLAAVDKRLEAICLKAFAPNPEARYSSASDLVNALNEYEDRLDSPSPRHRSIALVASTFLLVPLALVLILYGPAFWNTEINRNMPVIEGQSQSNNSVQDLSQNTAVQWNARSLANAWEEPQSFAAPLNGPNTDGSPTLSSDGLRLIFHRPLPSSHVYQLWEARRSSPEGYFLAPVTMPESLNGQHTTTNPRLSNDGLTLVFDSDRPGGKGNLDLWFAQRKTHDSPWLPHYFGHAVNSPASDSGPFLTEDGLTLLFASTRDEGYGEDDLWMATRKSTDVEFGNAVNLGSTINSRHRESHPWLSPDSCTLLFTSTRLGGYGGFDLWFSSRPSPTADFETPINAGPVVNTNKNEGHGTISSDGQFLYFESDRLGGQGNYDCCFSRRIATSPSQSPPSIDHSDQRQP